MENRAVRVLLAGFVVWWRLGSSFTRLSVFWCLQLDRQLVGSDFDSDDMGADEVAIISLCGILEMLAEGTSAEGLDLDRRHPAHRSDTPRLSVQWGRREIIPI